MTVKYQNRYDLFGCILIDILILSDDVSRYQIFNYEHIYARQIGFFDRNCDASAFQLFDIFGIFQYAFPFDQHEITF